MGAASRSAGVLAARQPHPESGDLRTPHLSPDRRRPLDRGRRPHRGAGLGERDGRLPDRHHAFVGGDGHRRAGHERPGVQSPSGGHRAMLHRRTRCRHRAGGVALLHRGGRRRSRWTDLGQPADRAARARIGVGIAGQLRPGAGSGLLGHCSAGALHADRAARDVGRGRPHAVRALLQLDGGAGGRHRRAGLVLPVPAV